ncbi:MAG: non-canonical purine NTP pyrophosphatase, partial [Bacteroidaceae bacterium]|nr:non-canonical purine NTP pyrophosphatase [Bacteroidaceae bacterium]
MTRKLLIMATNNEHKLKEVRQILDYKDILIKGLEEVGCYDDIPETADTLEGNALLKARYMYSHYGVDCFADDTGLEVDALNGAPGVFSARYAGDGHDSEA